jgi:Helix-turn-helix domain
MSNQLNSDLADLKLSDVLPLRDAATYSGYSLPTIRQYTWTGKLPSFKLGGFIRVVRKSDLDELRGNK